MSALSDEEIQQIIDEQLPGHVLVSAPAPASGETDAADGYAAPEADTPDIAWIRRRYQGERSDADGLAGGDAGSAENGGSVSQGDTVAWVRPAGQVDALAPGPGPKAVIISSDSKKIVGM